MSIVISVNHSADDLPTIQVNGKAIYPPTVQLPDPPKPISEFAPIPTALAKGMDDTTETNPPALRKAGEWYRNPYGFVIEQLTDMPTGAQHFYVAPHPISPDKRFLVFTSSQGGGLFLRDLKYNTQFQLLFDGVTPTSWAWNPTQPSMLFLTMKQSLCMFNAASGTNPAKVASFVHRDIPSDVPLMIGQTDGTRFVMDYRPTSKVSLGVILYDRVTDSARIYPATTLPAAPRGMNLTGAIATTDCSTVLLQVNGSNPSTLTYQANFESDPIKTARLMLPPTNDQPLGIVTGHAAVTSGHHHRLVGFAQGDGVGYVNGKDGLFWLTAIRSRNLLTNRDSDTFVWNPRTLYTGMHVAACSKSLLLSTYLEAPAAVSLPTAYNDELTLVHIGAVASITGQYPDPVIKIDNSPDVLRVGRHFSSGKNYWGQPRASISLDGTQGVFTSDMSGVLQVYRVYLT